MTKMCEQPRQHTSRIPVIFDEQDPQRLWPGFGTARSEISFCHSFGHRIERYLKRRAEATATAFRFDCAIVKADEMFGNCETEAKPAKLPGHRSIRLLKRYKQRRQPVGFNSNAVVRNFEVKTAAVVVEGADGDLPARRRKFRGVVDQVPKYLLKPNAIRRDMMSFRVEFGRDL